MDCQECRDRVHPTDPQREIRYKGKVYPSLCSMCDWYNSPERILDDRLHKLEERVGNLESITAEPGGIPRWYHDKIEQIRLELLHLKGKVIEARPKKPKAPPRSTYKGLASES